MTKRERETVTEAVELRHQSLRFSRLIFTIAAVLEDAGFSRAALFCGVGQAYDAIQEYHLGRLASLEGTNDSREAMIPVCRLVEELACSVDNAAEDIGGARPQLEILRDLVAASLRLEPFAGIKR